MGFLGFFEVKGELRKMKRDWWIFFFCNEGRSWGRGFRHEFVGGEEKRHFSKFSQCLYDYILTWLSKTVLRVLAMVGWRYSSSVP